MQQAILRRPDVEKLTGLSRSSIYAKMQTGEFPCPRRLGPRCVGWRKADIEKWLKELPSTSKLER